jgi:acetyl esterase/lipase
MEDVIARVAGPAIALVLAALCAACSAAPNVMPLWPGPVPEARGSADADIPTVTVRMPEGATGSVPAVVVCPGGGYHALMMDYEGHDVARWLNANGVAGIVLKYRVKPYPLSVSIADGKRAMRLVRAHAREWGIDPKRIGMMGFSAGGHLASSVGTGFDAGDRKAPDPVERASCRPDFLVLIYPSTTLGGGVPTDQRVTARTPPAFLAHSRTDQVVSVEESRRFYAALRAHGVAAEFLELPSGAHGLGCGTGELWAAWQRACLAWLRERKLSQPERPAAAR